MQASKKTLDKLHNKTLEGSPREVEVETTDTGFKQEPRLDKMDAAGIQGSEVDKSHDPLKEGVESFMERILEIKHSQVVQWQQSKKKYFHQNGLEFYRVRSGINDLPKLRF
jgi:hypothetical protein